MIDNSPNIKLRGQPSKLQRFDYFESLSEFCEQAQANKTAHRGPGWAGGSFEQAVALANDGWQDTVSDINTKISDVSETLKFAPTVDVTGDVVDMDLFLTGEPECMISYPLQPREVASVSIMVPICYSSMVDAESAKKRALAVAGAIEDFRFRGIMVTVYAYLCIAGKRDKLAVSLVKLADSRYAFDQGRVTYGAGHPTMLRQLMFAFEDGWNSEDHTTFDVRGGRGYPPYCLGRAEQEVADWVYGTLDTEITIDLPELEYSANNWSQSDHDDQISKILGDKTQHLA